jgi:glycosyltransferase involved in cell wall biosynthesis
VVCDRSATAPYEIDGIQVIRPPRRNRQRWLQDLAREQDLLVTHLDLTSQAMQLALDTKKPLAHFVHNSAQLEYWHVNTLKCQLAIFNSHWIAEAQQWEGSQITIHPVVEPEYYRCEHGDAIALVNPTSGKGAKIFYDLAQRFPLQPFITAQGGYGYQVACPRSSTGEHHIFYDETGSAQNCYGLPNVTHLKNDPDVRNVFRRTRVLLMPSDYESYGRVGVEAACAGIPTIAHPTPGLKEAFGNAAIFCDRNDIDSWAKEIERLLHDDIYYRQRSDAALALADSLTPEAEFDRLETALVATVRRWENKEHERMEKMWTSDRRLYWTADNKLTTDSSKAVKLCCGVGGEIPLSWAQQAGFVEKPTETTEPWIDTNRDEKMSRQPDNKMVDGPVENKGRKSRAAA